MHSFTWSLRHQLRETTIRVIEIVPPAVDTDLQAPGLHKFGVNVDVFADSVFQRLSAGETEIGFGMAEDRRVAFATAFEDGFKQMNAHLHFSPPAKVDCAFYALYLANQYGCRVASSTRRMASLRDSPSAFMASQIVDRLRDEIDAVKREPYLWTVTSASDLTMPKFTASNGAVLGVQVCDGPDIVLPHHMVTLEFVFTAHYGALPPIVKCPGDWPHSMVHSKSRVVILNLLQRTERGWSKSYSVLTVLHAFRMTLRPQGMPWEVRSPLLHRMEDKCRVHASEMTVAHCESGVACEMGTRSVMEDTYCLVDVFENPGDSLLGIHPALYCVADGHAGITCARFLVDNIQATLGQELTKDKSVREALYTTCLSLDKQFEETYAPYDDTSGSTLIGLFYDGLDKMYCVNVGDSRALLLRNERVIQISRDHRCSDVEEKAYITDRGGFIQNDRTFGQLTVTRAFGDADIKRAFGSSLAACPEISEWTISPEGDDIFVLACDGLYSVMSNASVARFVWTGIAANKPLTLLAKELANHCVNSCGGEDNTTVVIIRIKLDVSLSPTKAMVATSLASAPTTEDENAALVDTLLSSLEMESTSTPNVSPLPSTMTKPTAEHKSTKVPFDKIENTKALETEGDLMAYLMDDMNFQEATVPE
ncbi:protein phosphatase 2C [Achlya hypogyna]|uniref:Protein phosphatase 2C n=1 Tax=Achlya hypogyna TaxID=1202772 RepID=A0A1V9Z1X9_ACHHY|nr:protein phosphatase 2C [Achlya hypogyna]